MKLVVGLGNPGDKYKMTRHNMGFIMLDKYAKETGIKFKKKFEGQVAEFYLNNEKILLLKPQTFMNLSGKVVHDVMNFYKIDVEDIIIVYDDLDQQFSKIKIKKKSSSGGHNGIKDIINSLKTEDILRIKIGINNEFKKDVKDFVLSNFIKAEVKELDEIYYIVKNIIEDFIKVNDFLQLTNKYN